MTTKQYREADWNDAPGLLDGSINLELTPEQCDIEYWMNAVIGGTLRGQVHGHEPDAKVPAYLMKPGPLREAVLEEYAFRTISEELGTRAIGYMVANAPDWATMDFYATQLLDEARHAAVFRRHLVDLGVPESELAAFVASRVADKRKAVLDPMEEFALVTAGGKEDFLMCVVMLTVIVEGVLAPASEMSERKWHVLDPPASQTARGANIDEIRHLCVGSNIVRRHLQAHPEDKARLLEWVGKGMALWQELPIKDVIIQREALFQEGLQSVKDILGDYELVPGIRLIDTSIEDRLGIQMKWSSDMQTSRMGYMGLV